MDNHRQQQRSSTVIFSRLFWHGLLSNRWLSLAAASLVEASAGVSYMFGLYSQSFKETLGYNQKMLDMIGMAKDIGGNVGIISGFVGDLGPPWVVLLIGAIQNLIGYGFIWLVFTERVSAPPFWLVGLLICIGTNGATFFNTAGLVTCVKNFPSSRGPIVGLLKGYIGLSGALFSQFYLALYAPHRNSFLLMVSWLPSLVAIFAMPAIHLLPPPIHDPSEKSNLLLVLAVSMGLAIFLLLASLLEKAFVLSRMLILGIAFVGVAALAFPGSIAMQQEAARAKEGMDIGRDDGRGPKVKEGMVRHVSGAALESDHESGSDVEERAARLHGKGGPGKAVLASVMRRKAGASTSTIREGQLSSELLPSSNGSEELPEKTVLSVGDDYNLIQAVQTINFWLIYMAMTLASGSGLTAINNLGQIGRSLGYEQNEIGIFVSLMSIWNFFGRVGAGYASEYMMQEKGIPRPVFMVLTQLAMSVGHVLFSSALPGSVYFASIIVGLTYGAQWGLMPAIASEIFGLKHFGTLYNWLTITNPTGSYLLSVCVAGYLYDYEAEKEAAKAIAAPPPPFGDDDGGGDKPLMCHGAHCFRDTFLIMAAACILAAGLSLALTMMTKAFYAAEYQKQRNMKTEEAQASDEEGPQTETSSLLPRK